MLTQERLKDLMEYRPETGVFTRKKSLKNNVQSGDEAGHVSIYTSKISYRNIQIDGKNYKAHRLAFLYMKGEMPKYVDHIDGNGLNNMWVNLRQVTHSQNMRNRSASSKNLSGVTGVSFFKQTNKWRAAINTGVGTKKHLGYFDSLLDAVAARKSAERQFGYHENHGRIAA